MQEHLVIRDLERDSYLCPTGQDNSFFSESLLHTATYTLACGSVCLISEQSHLILNSV